MIALQLLLSFSVFMVGLGLGVRVERAKSGERFKREVLAGISAGTELAVKVHTAKLVEQHQLTIKRSHAQQVETIKGSVVAGVVAAQVEGKLTQGQAATLLGFTVPNYRRHRNTVVEAAMQLHRSKQ